MNIFLKYSLLLICTIGFLHIAQAQYAPPAGYPGTTAIHKDSANWVCWANAGQVQLGYKDISNQSLGFANTGSLSDAFGVAGEGGIISLGDAGQITLTFPYPIQNGQGADFAVFENGFNNTFLELAFVEVSSDGQRFVRFPAYSETDTSTQVNSFGSVDATKIHNLAGKYRANYGTPFDLEDLIDSTGIDLQAITHVRIIDVVGSVNPSYAGRDSRGFMVNDPWPTAFDSGGFDLDAVGVLNGATQLATRQLTQTKLRVFPNPVSNAEAEFTIELLTNTREKQFSIYNLHGQLIFDGKLISNTRISTINWPTGIYILQIDQDFVKINVL